MILDGASIVVVISDPSILQFGQLSPVKKKCVKWTVSFHKVLPVDLYIEVVS